MKKYIIIFVLVCLFPSAFAQAQDKQIDYENLQTQVQKNTAQYEKKNNDLMKLEAKIQELDKELQLTREILVRNSTLIEESEEKDELFYNVVLEKIANKHWTFNAMFAGLGLFIGFGSLVLGGLALYGYNNIKNSAEDIAKTTSINRALESIEKEGGILHNRIVEEVHKKVNRMLLGDQPDFASERFPPPRSQEADTNDDE